MSLTRAEWAQMWDDIKRIERAYEDGYPVPHSGVRREVREAVKRIKAQIEQVVGQME